MWGVGSGSDPSANFCFCSLNGEKNELQFFEIFSVVRLKECNPIKNLLFYFIWSTH